VLLTHATTHILHCCSDRHIVCKQLISGTTQSDTAQSIPPKAVANHARYPGYCARASQSVDAEEHCTAGFKQPHSLIAPLTSLPNFGGPLLATDKTQPFLLPRGTHQRQRSPMYLLGTVRVLHGKQFIPESWYELLAPNSTRKQTSRLVRILGARFAAP
jgi:hypothetical protein